MEPNSIPSAPGRESPGPGAADAEPPRPASRLVHMARRRRRTVAYSAYALATVGALVFADGALFDLQVPET